MQKWWIIALVVCVFNLLSLSFAHQDEGRQWVNDWVEIEISVPDSARPYQLRVTLTSFTHGSHDHWPSTQRYFHQFASNPSGYIRTVRFSTPRHEEVAGTPECTPSAGFQFKMHVRFLEDSSTTPPIEFEIAAVELSSNKVEGESKGIQYYIVHKQVVMGACTDKVRP